MSLRFGIHKGSIVSHSIECNDNGNTFVYFELCPDEEPATGVYSKVFVTSAAAGIARARLKACGFNIDEHDLEELQSNPNLLAGNPVEFEVSEDQYNGKIYTKIEILIPRKAADKSALKSLTQAMRAAKNRDGEEKTGAPKAPVRPPPKPEASKPAAHRPAAAALPRPPAESTLPPWEPATPGPAVDGIPADRKAELEAQAAGDDIPF